MLDRRRRSRSPGSRSRRRRKNGLVLFRVDGPLRSQSVVSGLYLQDTWSGKTCATRASRCRGGRLRVLLGSDQGLFTPTAAVIARGSGRVVGRASVTPARDDAARAAARARQRALRGRLHRRPDGRPRAVTHGRTPIRASSARTSSASRTAHVRIVFDVTPALAPADGRRQLPARRARGPRRGGRAGATRSSRSRRRARAGRRCVEESLAGVPARRALRDAPARARLAHRLEPRRVAAGRALPRRLRRAPLLRLDVPAAALAALRATTVHDLVPLRFPSGRPAHAADARREVPQRGAHAATSSSPTRSSPRATSWSCSACRASGSASRTRASAPSSRPTATRADLGRPYVLTVATLEPRKNLGDAARRARAARRRARARGRRRRGLGRAAGAASGRAWSALGYVPTTELPAPLPRRGGVRVPVALRGLRDPGARGDGLRSAVRRLVARVARRGVRRRCRARRPGRARRRSRPRSARRSSAATSSCRRARARAPLHLARDRGGAPRRLPSRRCDPRRYRPLAARADPRRDGALHARPPAAPRARAGLELVRLAYEGSRRTRRVLRDTAWYLGRLPREAARGCDVLHCPTYRAPLRSSVPVVVTVHDLALLRHPERVQPLDARRTAAAARPRVLRAARA